MKEKLHLQRLMLLNKIHSFYEGNGKTGKTVFANDDMMRQISQTNLNYVSNNVIVSFGKRKESKVKRQGMKREKMEG